MKSTQLFLLIISLILPTFALASEHAEHKHGSENHAQLRLNDGKKWHVDETLRQSMDNIHASVAAALPAIHAGKLSSLQYDALGKEITTQIAFIVQNCKLDPEADEQLHHIIAGMTGGITMATGKRSARERASGIQKIAESLNTYGNYFDHLKWRPIELVAH